MKFTLGKFDNRRVIMFGMGGAIIMLILFVTEILSPALDGLTVKQTAVENAFAQHGRLVKNVSVRDFVEQEFANFADEAFQNESDQITVSQFLRDVESLARQPNMTLLNMKPMPVKVKEQYKIYRVRLSAVGKLQDIVTFVSSLTNRKYITGLSSLSIRGVQGHGVVECTLSIWMVRLLPNSPQSVVKAAVSGGKK